MSKTYVTYRVWGGCKAPLNLEYDGRLIGEIAREPTVDRDALLALADEFDEKADYIASCIESMEGDFDMHAVEAEAEQREYARRIREACGEVEG
jgi:hypothetical protein